MADLLFTSYGFPATGAPTSRTMPDRLAEIHNVLDFGADPTGALNCSTAIQAAVDVVSAAGRGTVYFPLGTYRIDTTITFNLDDELSIRFLGEGMGTTLSANSLEGFVLERKLATPNNQAFVVIERMRVSNPSTDTASGGIRIGSTIHGCIRDVSLSGYVGLTTEDSAGNSSQNIYLNNCKIQSSAGASTRGLIIGGSGAMHGCDFIGSDIAVLAYGNGFHMAGQRIEDCNTAYQLGLDSAGNNVGMSGFSLNGSTEGNLICIDMAGTCTGGFIGPIGMSGHEFTSGVGGGGDSQHGLLLRADCAQGCVFFNLTPNSWFEVAGIEIEDATSRANNVFIACNPAIVGGAPGVPWILPTNAYTARLFQCNVNPVWAYSELPSGGDVLEGDEFDIDDSNTATWGATAAGGGSDNVSVRWNGSNYTVVGK